LRVGGQVSALREVLALVGGRFAAEGRRWGRGDGCRSIEVIGHRGCAGSVGHWGHVHQWRNQYRAVLDVAPVDGEWKLVALEILEEERL
jgi:hypothetical protein